MIRQRGLFALLLGLASCALVACTDESSQSELTLRITSDLTVPDELDRVTVSVVGQDVSADPSADLRERSLPRSLTLVHEAGPLGPVQITVRGFRGSIQIVQKDVQAWFPASGENTLEVLLERACQALTCESGSTCEQGRCVPVGDPLDAGMTVPDDAQTGPRRDASGSDAARDAQAELDGSLPDDAALHENDAALDGASASDAQSDTGASDAGDAAAHSPDAGTPPIGAGSPPVCTLSLPVLGDSYQINTAVPLTGSCSDPETGPLSTGLRWSSTLDGLLGSGARLTVPLKRVGLHQLSLCAPDPRDATVLGCAAVTVTVSLLAQPSATSARSPRRPPARVPTRRPARSCSRASAAAPASC